MRKVRIKVKWEGGRDALRGGGWGGWRPIRERKWEGACPTTNGPCPILVASDVRVFELV